MVHCLCLCDSINWPGDLDLWTLNMFTGYPCDGLPSYANFWLPRPFYFQVRSRDVTDGEMDLRRSGHKMQYCQRKKIYVLVDLAPELGLKKWMGGCIDEATWPLYALVSLSANNLYANDRLWQNGSFDRTSGQSNWLMVGLPPVSEIIYHIIIVIRCDNAYGAFITWHKSFESSSDECKNSARRLPTLRPSQPTWAVS